MVTAVIFAALVNLGGTVTFAREGDPYFFIRDLSDVNWRVAPAEGAAVKVAVGDLVSAAGEREPTAKHRVVEAEVKVLGRDVASVPEPREIALGELFAGLLPFGNPDWYGGVFVTEGTVRDINRRQASTQLLVGEGDLNFQVELPLALDDTLPAALALGAAVRVTGVLVYTSIENIEAGDARRIENVELLVADERAVRVIRRAPFWSARRVWTLFGTLAALVVLVTVWAATLRGMLRRKIRELAESIRARETVRIEADAALRERLRLAADLHDGFQQYLAGSMFRLQAAVNYLPEGAAESREQLENARIAIEHAQTELRTTLLAMNAESEAPESIVALFNYVSRRMGHWDGVVTIASAGEERKVARRSAGTLLLILQEAVGNAIRHGAATHVDVRVEFAADALTLTVRDDGAGFDTAAPRPAGHYGLSGMERRIADLGGTMSLASAPGRGTTLVFTVPYRAD